MTVVLLEPHFDDAVLFASYTLLRERPKVITVLGGDTVQEPEITSDQRANENWRAMRTLDWDIYAAAWIHSERDPDWSSVRDHLVALRQEQDPDVVWVPLPEDGGHDHHNLLATTAIEVFNSGLVPSKMRYYATYRRGSGRTRTDTEVIPEPDWPARKYAAMACFSSQINLPATQPWFAADDCLREWIA